MPIETCFPDDIERGGSRYQCRSLAWRDRHSYQRWCHEVALQFSSCAFFIHVIRSIFTSRYTCRPEPQSRRRATGQDGLARTRDFKLDHLIHDSISLFPLPLGGPTPVIRRSDPHPTSFERVVCRRSHAHSPLAPCRTYGKH